MKSTSEAAFETAIEDVLLADGYQTLASDAFDRERAIFGKTALDFIRSTQPKPWEKLYALHGDRTGERVLEALCKWLDTHGVLTTLRHGFKCFGKTLRIAFFRPAHGLNPDLEARYQANRMGLTRQLHFSPKSEQSLDVVLSVIVARDLTTDSKERVGSHKAQLAELKNAYSAALVGIVPGHDYAFSEGVRLRLDQAAGRWWCVFEPFTDVELPRPVREEDLSDDESFDRGATSFRRTNPVADWQRERWARRYNSVWSRILSAWANILAGENGGRIQAFDLQEGSGLDAVFQLSPVTAWSRPSHEHDYFLRGGR